MNGLELAKGYYEEFGKPMLESEFADILPFLAAGFVGSGSEHYGFDDVVSRDHDFEPGFCIFLPGEDVVDRRRAFQLERAYSKLPLFSDTNRTVIEAYDIWEEKKLYGKTSMGVVRTTYLIDENGTIVFANDKVKAADDAEKMLSQL